MSPIFRYALVLAALPLAAQPTGDRWLAHLEDDLLPFWTMPAALGDPVGSFPSTRCDDGSLLDFANPCPPIAGNEYLTAPAQYLVPLSRQTFGYGVAYHLTGNATYLAYMKAGVDYIRRHAIDPNGGMFESLDLVAGAWGPDIRYRDPQQLGYGLLGMAFYYYLTRDQAVLPDIVSLKNYIFDNYYNPSLGTMQWMLADNGGVSAHSRQLVADLDQMNTYLVLLTPTLPEPYQTQFKESMTLDAHAMLGTFFSPADNLFFLRADTPQDTDIASTGVDVGHSSKAFWMIRWAGMLTGDQGLVHFAEAGGRRLLDRAFMPESDGSGSWAGGVQAGGALDPNKSWWVYDELDQLAGSLALEDISAGLYLTPTTNYWFTYFVDHQYGEVWNGVNYPANTPQRGMPKSWQWKNAYHDFEHVLVGYITSQWLMGQPVTLYYAFTDPASVDPVTIRPYYFSSTIDSIDGPAVTFHPVSIVSTAIVTTSAASFLKGPLSPGSIATAWGTNLPSGPVTITDSAGNYYPAEVFYSSPTQMNFLIPDAVAPGPAYTTFGAQMQIAGVSPGIFQMNGEALAAAIVVRLNPDQSQSYESVQQPIRIREGAVYLSIFATGLRHAQSVAVTVGGQMVPVTYSGAQGTYDGLDQVNVGPLPVSLAGRGKVTIVLTADGQTANPVQVAIE